MRVKLSKSGLMGFFVSTVLVLAVSEAVGQVANVVYGPKTIQGSLIPKLVSEAFKAKSGVSGFITLVNSNGISLVKRTCTSPKKISELSAFVECLRHNFNVDMDTIFRRPREVYLSLNGVVLLQGKDYNGAAGKITIPIKTKTGTPIDAVTNDIQLKVTGFSGASLTVKVEAGTDTTPPILTINPESGTTVDSKIVSFTGTSNKSLSHMTATSTMGSVTISLRSDKLTFVGTMAVSSRGSKSFVIKGSDLAENLREHAITYHFQYNTAPSPLFLATPGSASPLTVSFDASMSTDPEADLLSFLWDFGDGTTGMGSLSIHTYTQTGNFQVKLTVKDQLGLSSQATKTISVIDNVGPIIGLVTPQNGETINSRRVLVMGTVSEPSTVTVNGLIATVDAFGKFEALTIAASEGDFPIRIVAKDASGNETESLLRVNIYTGLDQLWTYEECPFNGSL